MIGRTGYQNGEIERVKEEADVEIMIDIKNLAATNRLPKNRILCLMMYDLINQHLLNTFGVDIIIEICYILINFLSY